MSKKLNVVLVGLGFRGQFVPIYSDYPNVASVRLFDPNKNFMDFYLKRYGCDKTYNSFDEIIEDKSVDAVHLISPIPLHKEQTLKVLELGKHCASTVLMSLSLEGA